jgi:hypothetical protein
MINDNEDDDRIAAKAHYLRQGRPVEAAFAGHIEDASEDEMTREMMRAHWFLGAAWAYKEVMTALENPSPEAAAYVDQIGRELQEFLAQIKDVMNAFES